MEGLESSELKLSELETGIRIDAELYKKELVFFERKIRAIAFSSLGEEVKLIKKGIFDIKADCYIKEGVPFVRISNLKGCLIDTSDIVFIPEEENEKNIVTCLSRNDIILSKTANAAASLVNLDKCNTSQDTVAVKLKENSHFLSHYVVIFLNTKYGLKQMQRWFTGNIQMHLNLEDCKENLLIPLYSICFQEVIKSLFEEFIKVNAVSKATYKKAESLLFRVLTIDKLNVSENSIAIKSFKESFLQTGRLDAEFYQPFYDEIEAILKGNGYEVLENICSEINYGTVPTSPYTEDGSGIPYIKGTNFKNTIIDNEGLDRLVNTDSLPERFFTKEGDIIISQMGTVGDTGVVEKNQEGWLFASFTIRARIKDKKKFDPHFIAFFIQHIAKPYYLHRYIAQASVRQNTDLPTVKNMYIPKLKIETQREICSLVKQSFKQRQESHQLLDSAKHAVELAIEENEEEATQWLKSQNLYNV